MDALILAGGLGTRLARAVPDRAKSVADVGGRPFLHYQLERLSACPEVRRAILCVGHLAPSVEAALGARFGRLEIAYSRERSPLGTGGALRNALEAFGLRHGPVLALNGDCLSGARVADLVAFHRARRALVTLAAVRVADASRYGALSLEADRVVGFAEKGSTGPCWINAGWYVLSGQAVASLRSGPEAFSFERDRLAPWGATGRLRAYLSRSRFIDIGTPEDYGRAESLLARRAKAR